MTLRAVPPAAPAVDPDAVVRAAYRQVAEGIRRALEVPGIEMNVCERDRLRRMYRHALEMAGESHVAGVK